MSDIVAYGSRCGLKELEMIMGAKTDETLGLHNMVGTSSWSEIMHGQSTSGLFDCPRVMEHPVIRSTIRNLTG